MREILFRGKRKDNGEWVVSNSLIHSMYKKGDVCIGVVEGLAIYRVIPETVGQYTGLTDYSEYKKKIFTGHIIKCRHEWTGQDRKKELDIEELFEACSMPDLEMQEQFKNQNIRGAYGKHTEENDIRRCFYYYRNYVVEYYAPNGRYRVRNGSVFHDLTLNFIINRKAIIIGNIHDNPELLGGGEE